MGRRARNTCAKAENSDDPDRIHFYLDPCGLSGSLNHIPAYISFKIDACSRASNGGAFEPFHSKDVPQAKLALIDTLELLDIDPNILDMTETKKFKDNPKNFAIFKLPTLEAAGRLLNCPPVRTHIAVPFDGVQATITPLALTRVIVEKQAQPVALSPSVGLPGEILPHTISILASSKHSAIFEKYCSPENLSGWLANTLNFLPNVFTETSLPPTVKALLEGFSEPDFLYALGNNHKPYPGIIVTLARELASFLVANGLYYLEGREWKGPLEVQFLSNLHKSIKTGTQTGYAAAVAQA